MHYYINWALCNLPTFILPDVNHRSGLDQGKSASKRPTSQLLSHAANFTRAVSNKTSFRRGSYHVLTLHRASSMQRPLPSIIPACVPVTPYATSKRGTA